MEKRNLLTKILAVAGTIFVWLPIVAPILFSIVALAAEGRFRLDFLMPAELFPAVLLGAGLLLWAAQRARSQRAIIGWGLLSSVVLLAGGQALAVITGLASGETEPTGWKWALVLGSLILYCLAVVAIGVGGALLLRDLFKKRERLLGAAS